MSLRWRVEGIEMAERAGGIRLEVYRRPGFVEGGLSVRRAPEPGYFAGLEASADPDPYDDWDE